MASREPVDRMRFWPPYRTMRVWLWAMNLPPELTPAVSGIEAGRFQCRPVEPSEAGDVAAALGLPLEIVTSRQAWSRCHAGRVGDDIATCGWVSAVDTWVGEIAGTIRPGDREAYIWDCRTVPAYRRRGLYGHLLGQISVDLARSGYRRAWIATADGKSPGYRGVARSGFRRVLRIRCLEVGPLRWWAVRPGPAADEEEIRAARRALRLGHAPERMASTKPTEAPPAPVPG